MFKFFKKTSKNFQNVIKGFDKELFLKANPEISKKYKKNFDNYFIKEGLKDIREGKLKFHPDYEPYNEEKYLNKFLDIKEAVREGEFKSGFEHFCIFGYQEIIEGIRDWTKTNTRGVKNIEADNSISKVNKNKIILVLGIPRSGITLLTGLIGSSSKVTEWFMPYSTRKNLGIKKFNTFEDIKNEYFKAFPQENEFLNNIVLSESTSDENTIPWIFDSLDKLKENNEIKIIWIVRDIGTSYLSFVEAARLFWGAKNLKVEKESFIDFLNLAKRSYKQIVENIIDYEHKIITYKDLIENSKESLNEIMNFIDLPYESSQINNFRSFIKDFKVAGCQKFLEFNEIKSDREKERYKEWEKYSFLINELNEKDRNFINDFSSLVDNKYKNLDEYSFMLINNHFDKNYYLETYEDIKENKINPIVHYLEYGWKEGRKPASYFDTEWYKENVEYGTFNPFIHWHLIGKYFFELGEKKEPEIEILENLKLIEPENYQINSDLKLIAPIFDNPKVSIIIPAYNQANYTLACVESIIKNTENVSYEIIIMDDNSPDPKAREIEKYMENVIFISNGINYGFLENCNKGAKIAKGEYILFLNNDTNVQPNWLSSLVELIESDEKIGMVGSKLVYPNGQQQEAGGIVWKDASAWNFGRLDNPNKPEYNYVKECDYISGASIMIKKDLWNKIGGFDKRYKPAYFEDSDLAFEVRKHGYKVMFQPKSIVVHFEGISHGTDTSSGIKSYQVKNREKFIEKWKDVLEKEQFANAEHVFLARDRSRFKKHILFIDHYLPHFDQDAGSRTVYQYIKFFVKNNFQVHFIGDNFWHYPGTPYLEALQQLGVEVLYGSYYANHWKDWLKENGKYFDYVFLNRPHISIKYIDEIKKYSNAKIIYYGHDLHFARLEKEYEITKNEKTLEDLNYFKKLEIEIMKKSDVVLYPSYLEKQIIKNIDKDINVFDVPAYIFENFDSFDRNIEQTSDIMFIGGFSHAPNVDAIKWFIKDIFPKIKKSIPEIKFYIIGSNPPEDIKSLHNGIDIFVTGYITDEELMNFYKNIRVSVVPLRYGGGVKGKVVEALYYNMPIVTTSVGAEGLPNVENYLIIKDNADDFANSVIELYKNIELLKHYSNGREYCKNYFSYKTIKNIFSNFIDFKGKE